MERLTLSKQNKIWIYRYFQAVPTKVPEHDYQAVRDSSVTNGRSLAQAIMRSCISWKDILGVIDKPLSSHDASIKYQ